jgi:hypothetical protein
MLSFIALPSKVRPEAARPLRGGRGLYTDGNHGQGVAPGENEEPPPG